MGDTALLSIHTSFMATAASSAATIKQWTSTDEIDKAVVKLRRRIAEAESFDVDAELAHRSGQAGVLLSSIQNTLLEIFGEHSPEYRENSSLHLWSGPLRAGTSLTDRLTGTERGRARIVALLNGLVARLLEKREDFDEDLAPTAKAIAQYLNLHPRIADVASDLFEDGYHWEAVFAASKALINYVKERSGKHDVDGTGLVRLVFSKNSPILMFNELKDQTDLDEQEGMMHLFEGVVLGIRNPGGHAFPEGTQQRATEYLSLISLLAYRTQEAKRKR
jgi:uncharacterized protein (TIGR02391 family)